MTASIMFSSPGYPSSTVTPYRSLVVYTEPAVEPVSLAEAKVQCKVDTDDENSYIEALVKMSRTYVEQILDVALVNQTLEARYDSFPLWELILPRAPMSSASVTVTYRNEAGGTGTITSAAGDFQVDHRVVPGRIYPNYQGVWPAVRGDENSVVVRWQAGYGAAGSDVPQLFRHLILLQTAHLHENRQPVVTGYSQVLTVPHTFETLLAAAGWGSYR